MRILLLQDQVYFPAVDDAQRSHHALLAALAAEGHPCAAAAPAFGPAACPTRTRYFGEWAERGLSVAWASAEADVYELGPGGGVEVHAVLNPTGLEAYGMALMERFAPDVVLVSVDGSTALLTALPPDTPARVAALAHGPLPLEPTAEGPDGGPPRLDAVLTSQATLVPLLEARVAPLAAVPPVRCLPLAAEEGPPEAVELAAGEVILLAEACREGGLERFLALADRFPDHPFATVESFRTTEEDHDALAARPNVEILEPGPADELFAEARVLVAPAVAGWRDRTAILRALLRGVPVLVSDADGVGEARLGTDPEPLPTTDTAAWAAALAPLLEDEALHTARATAAREAALAHLAKTGGVALAAALEAVQPRPRERRAAPAPLRERSTAPAPSVSVEPPTAPTLDHAGAAAAAAAGRAADGPHVSLFFFSADGSSAEADRYRLLHDSVRFADRNGFTAVWTPERHFNAFGGLYPNPSVTSAALAMITERLQLRAGSVVLPLQNPIRVVEEWAVVDNLSKGRVSLAFATGWHVNDFVLAPGNYDARRDVLYRELETVRQLWRGGKVRLTNGAGNDVEVEVFPRPVQAELPVWITCQSDNSFELAGRSGANILTNMNQKSLDDFAKKAQIYRQARSAVGLDPAAGVITMMLHTYVTDDIERAQDQLKSAYGGYLLTNMGLQMQLAAGLGKNVEVGEEERDVIMEMAFNRLLESHGLVGTPEACIDKARAFHAAGVDELGCLIDFGLDIETVLAGLEKLNRVREGCQPVAQGEPR